MVDSVIIVAFVATLGALSLPMPWCCIDLPANFTVRSSFLKPLTDFKSMYYTVLGIRAYTDLAKLVLSLMVVLSTDIISLCRSKEAFKPRLQ